MTIETNLKAMGIRIQHNETRVTTRAPAVVRAGGRESNAGSSPAAARVPAAP